MTSPALTIEADRPVAEAESLHVEVASGEVTLGGEVETPDVAELLPAFVKRVPGVVSVRSHVTSRSDGRVTARP